MNSISGVNTIAGPAQKIQPSKETGKGFLERLDSAVKEVNNKQHVANNAIEQVVKGELGIHEGMLAIGEADVSLKLLLGVRSKAMAAYQEIIKMPV